MSTDNEQPPLKQAVEALCERLRLSSNVQERKLAIQSLGMIFSGSGAQTNSEAVRAPEEPRQMKVSDTEAAREG